MTHILLTEAAFAESAAIEPDLRAAGFRTSRCHGEAGICQAVAPSGQCPLDGADPVDVAVVVRSFGRTELSTREYGAVCATRAGVPVLITSAEDLPRPAIPPALNGLAQAAVPRSDLADACRRLAGPRPGTMRDDQEPRPQALVRRAS